MNTFVERTGQSEKISYKETHIINTSADKNVIRLPAMILSMSGNKIVLDASLSTDRDNLEGELQVTNFNSYTRGAFGPILIFFHGYQHY